MYDVRPTFPQNGSELRHYTRVTLARFQELDVDAIVAKLFRGLMVFAEKDRGNT